MAKKSKIARNEQRRELIARYVDRRAELKHIVKSPDSSDSERLAAQEALNRLPKNSSPVRLRNRDSVDGRPRGYVGKFGLSRVKLRELALSGDLPGVTKSSW